MSVDLAFERASRIARRDAAESIALLYERSPRRNEAAFWRDTALIASAQLALVDLYLLRAAQ